MTPPEIDPIQYDLTAALNQGAGLQPQQFEALIPRLEAARSEVLKDVELLRSPEKIPAEKEPLDARFIDFPAGLLAEYAASRTDSTVARSWPRASAWRRPSTWWLSSASAVPTSARSLCSKPAAILSITSCPANGGVAGRGF